MCVLKTFPLSYSSLWLGPWYDARFIIAQILGLATAPKKSEAQKHKRSIIISHIYSPRVLPSICSIDTFVQSVLRVSILDSYFLPKERFPIRQSDILGIE